jgi:hypothetical protein
VDRGPAAGDGSLEEGGVMAPSKFRRPGGHRRGTATVMMILITSILTGLVLTLALAAGVQSDNTRSSILLDQANAAAEAACQTAVWQFKHSIGWRQTTPPGTLPTMTSGSNTYTYSVTCVDAGNTANLYWPFNEGSGTTTADMSGNGNTGNLIGGVTWTTQGVYGDALVFDGSTGYVDAGNKPSTNIVGSVTMSAWVKMNTAGNDQKVGGNQDGNSGGYKMSIYGLKAEFEVRDANNNATLNRSVAGGTILTMGVWYNVVGVYNAQTNTIQTYINGVLDRTLTGVEANALASTTGDFIMGREPWVNTSTRFFNGTIDDVRVYASALNAQQISTIANSSVHITAAAALKTPAYAYPPTGYVNLIACYPTPLPPTAPTLVVGGAWPMKLATVSGDVQVAGNVTGSAASSVNGNLYYGGTYSDPHSYITIMYKGKTATAIPNAAITVPTINYANVQAQAVTTYSGNSSGATYQFPALYSGQVPVIYVNGNVTNPNIDTSQSGGTLLINGTLTLSGTFSYGSSGNPAYIICEKAVTQTSGTLTLYGGLYVNGNWTHNDCTIYGDVSVSGSITDNSSSGSTYVNGAIPWFDPRSSAATIQLPVFYTSYQGVIP